MSNRMKKRAYVVDRYHEHRAHPEIEKIAAIGVGLHGEIFDGVQFSSWAKRRLDQAVSDVLWLKHLETRYIDVPHELKEMLHGL